MLRLCGFPISNYYNKVKLGLIEKGIKFEEVRAAPSRTDPELLKKSPMGRIPFLEHEGNFVFESNAILEYVEEVHPEPPMLPKAPIDRAACRQIIYVVDQYLDWTTRPYYGRISEGTLRAEEIEAVRSEWKLAAGALQHLLKLSPFACGASYTYADASVQATVGIIREAARVSSSEDPFKAIPGFDEYLSMLKERDSSKKVERARKAAKRAMSMASK